ncbi:SCP2 domain-containing protein [Endozoicomonas sp. SCSIO W0465]|uniref:ubiquinone anaerobic biosynthesis accessory factor UbiT n=1 Tax=Endozoicomonas sp. SCSIO W0465 TaxID=2918516 RepID=UPI0020755A4F|nr:SCP2 sterol-binding domain-containing protein [Endozoicomonas sp. SCSIO W0465]USE33896.1 SCP2 sterol-binding domain-containing protein [Endozoicomonas sp. SCSIO W0465]
MPSFRLPLPGINLRERFKKPGIELLGLPVKLLPSAVVNKPLTKAINQIFHVPVKEGDFDFLEDRCLKIQITDINVSFYISFDGRQLSATTPRRFDVDIHDVEFQGDSKSFLKLASRQEDPDTLFFQRSLMIEGDTELGLGVKNLLDSLELEQLPIPVQKLAWLGQQLQKKIQPIPAH